MPSKKSKKTPYRQTTLFECANSSPSRASCLPSRGQAASSPVSGTSKRKRAQSSTEGESADAGSDSDVGAIQFVPEVIELSEDEVLRSPTKRQRRSNLKRVESATNSCRSTSPSPLTFAEEDEETKESQPVKPPRRGKGKSRRVISDDSKSESEVEHQPTRRKLVKGVRPLTPEEDELDEVDASHIIEPRLRARDKQSLFQKNLEKLKRKKRGQPIDLDSEEDEEEATQIDDDAPFSGSRPTDLDADSDDSDAYYSNKDEDSFVVPDDGPGVEVQLPAMFSMDSYQDLAHNFKIICQLFVHLAVLPESTRQDTMESVTDGDLHAILKFQQELTSTLQGNEYFSLPLQMARRKIKGMRDSLVTSSVWQPGFKKVLEKYPTLDISQLQFATPACAACNLGGRISTLVGRLSGRPYDPVGFIPHRTLREAEDEEDYLEFHLGRFCARRTRVFHQFTHWQYDLFQALLYEVDELRQSQENHGFVKVASASGVKPPRDWKDADKIMDWLDDRKVIGVEWVKLKDMMESARNLEVASKRGGQDEYN